MLKTAHYAQKRIASQTPWGGKINLVAAALAHSRTAGLSIGSNGLFANLGVGVFFEQELQRIAA